MTNRTRLTTAALALTLAATAAPASAATFAPASNRVTNPWYPLHAGSTWVYHGSDEGHRTRDVMRVLRKVTTIDGVRCATIDDRVFTDGRLTERTTDYYAQDTAGNVRYLGEDTATLRRDGSVQSREGSFRQGRDGARGGIFMPADPKVGDAFEQEHYPSHAEDHFSVVSTTVKVSTPAARSTHALLTRETTPIEPGVVDHKVYVRGIGTVVEKTIKGGSESLTLVSFKRG